MSRSRAASAVFGVPEPAADVQPGAAASLRHWAWNVFFQQVVAIAIATIVGVFLTTVIVRDVLLREFLEQEAAAFWQAVQQDDASPLPRTAHMRAFLLRPHQSDTAIPEEIRGLEAGYHSLPGEAGQSLLLIDAQAAGTLFLRFDASAVNRIAVLFGVVPLTLALLGLYLVVWLNYRSSRHAVSPLIWLAEVVSHWDTQNPDVSAIEPSRLPPDAHSEIGVLAAALHDFAMRNSLFLAREKIFTRDASHELRSPLTIIRLAIEMLSLEQSLSNTGQRSLERIGVATDEMEALIESLLILAREEDLGTADEHFSVADLVAQQVHGLQATAKRKGLSIELAVEQDFLLAVPRRVLGVITGSLIRLAIQHSSAGSVHVRIGEGFLEVADSGFGMDAESIRQAFQMQHRATDETRSGHGLGLTIVQRLTDRFAWPLEIDSEPGRGTRIAISFPNAIPAEPTAAKPA